MTYEDFHTLLVERMKYPKSNPRKFHLRVVNLRNGERLQQRFGEKARKQAIQRVASTLTSYTQSEEIIGRIGSESFGILLDTDAPVQNVRSHYGMGDRFDSIVRELQEKRPYLPIELGQGIAAFPDAGETVWDILRAASKAEAEEGDDVHIGLMNHIRPFLAESFAEFTVLDTLITAIAQKDAYTRTHCEETAVYSQLIATELEMEQSFQMKLIIAALIHDVGKISIPDAILTSSRRLSSDEFDVMKHHARIGGRLVRSVFGLQVIWDAVEYHHEAWNGGGYPDGLMGKEIPLAARILAVADTFSALTSHRSYRRAVSWDEALSVLESGKGIQWDQTCVEALVSAVQKIPAPLRVPKAIIEHYFGWDI